MLTFRQRQTITTPDVVYQAHRLEIERFADGTHRVRIINTSTEDVMRAVEGDVDVESEHGEQWRIVAHAPEGDIVWRSIPACSCHLPSTRPTEDYEVPA